jgi:adenosylcobinamide kinase/adenosylcobinamide-phosphate guanylyltransferase
MPLTLVTGGVRSGKSSFAERLAARHERVVYVATAFVDPTDAEMQARITHHRTSRDAAWPTIETGAGEPTLERVLREATPEAALLVDSLGSWLGAAMYALEAEIERDAPRAEAALEDDVARLREAFAACRAPVVLVSEEVGYGVVPPSKQGRVFRDVMGRANQKLAALADEVYLVVAGIPLDLKALGAFTSLPD